MFPMSININSPCFFCFLLHLFFNSNFWNILTSTSKKRLKNYPPGNWEFMNGSTFVFLLALIYKKRLTLNKNSILFLILFFFLPYAFRLQLKFVQESKNKSYEGRFFEFCQELWRLVDFSRFSFQNAFENRIIKTNSYCISIIFPRCHVIF